MSGVNDNTRAARRAGTMLHALILDASERSNDRGASMVEYGLLLVFVLLAAFFTVQIFGDSLVGLFDASANTLESAPNVNPEG